jgi:hypothetical protein
MTKPGCTSSRISTSTIRFKRFKGFKRFKRFAVLLSQGLAFQVDRVWKGEVFRDLLIYQVMMNQLSMYPPGTPVPDRMAPQPYPNALPL